MAFLRNNAHPDIADPHQYNQHCFQVLRRLPNIKGFPQIILSDIRHYELFKDTFQLLKYDLYKIDHV